MLQVYAKYWHYKFEEGGFLKPLVATANFASCFEQSDLFEHISLLKI